MPTRARDRGSGIIIADNGQELLILTERKVLSGAQSIYVTFVNDTSVEASVRKYDGNTGIAVLCVPNSEIDDVTRNEISVAVLGNSFAVGQGDAGTCSGKPTRKQLFDLDRKYYRNFVFRVYD